ncbi:TPA: sigma-70 family RNA polymerase sigma factor [Candidatus Poribacteria bacterium]|nr:sigma-70 family RNA polymerase sigma factor [Candidatus Poribacteria bacterium]
MRHKVKTESDKEAEMLAMKVKDGDLKAFETLHKMYNHLVFSIVYGVLNDYEDAQDVTQEVFLNAWRALIDDKWKPQKGATFRAWIGRIATNRAIDLYRRQGRLQDFLPLADEVDTDSEETIAVHLLDQSPTPEEAAIMEDNISIVRRVIHEINKRYREVIMKYYFAQQTVVEIAEELGMPQNTVKVWLYRGRLEMREKLIKAGIKGLD